MTVNLYLKNNGTKVPIIIFIKILYLCKRHISQKVIPDRYDQKTQISTRTHRDVLFKETTPLLPAPPLPPASPPPKKNKKLRKSRKSVCMES